MAQQCPLHLVELVAGGRRYASHLIIAPTYFRLERKQFPRANALRRVAGNGRRMGQSTVHYCPQCREELQVWCREQVAEGSNARDLAAGLLMTLFSDNFV
jgi:hypothetical protein